jgi:2,3-bisphosphoglycerate-dependent phosphoglycerate mutase
MKTVYFVRHGECRSNVERRIAGLDDSPLTAKGIEQADATGVALAGKQIDLVLTSPLARAKDTAERIVAGIGYKGQIRTEPLLAERNYGSVSGQLGEVGFPLLDAGKVPDAETFGQLAERMTKVLALLKTLPTQYILVVGHSGTEIMLRTLYEGRPHTTFLDTRSLRNGEIREYAL